MKCIGNEILDVLNSLNYECSVSREGILRIYEIISRYEDKTCIEDDSKKLNEYISLLKDVSTISSVNDICDKILELQIVEKIVVSNKKLIDKKIFITDKCIGCTKCSRVCPVDCIEGTIKKLHIIKQNECITCQTCITVCPVKAIILEKEVLI